MPSLIDFRRRIRSVKNTQQITKAMKMVAAARMRRSQGAILSARPFAVKMEDLIRDLHAVHHARKLPYIVDGNMQRATVVPYRDRAFLPAKAAGEFGACRVLQQKPKQWRALLGGHCGKALRIRFIDEQGFAAGFGVRTHDGMLRHRLAPLCVFAHLVRAMLVAPGLRPRNRDVAVHGLQVR